MVGKRGVFFTFMAFLLVGTLITLTGLLSQAETGQDTILAQKAALGEVKNAYTDIDKQLLGMKARYDAERTPFSDFQSGTDWVSATGEVPLQDLGSDESFDAINLFNVFLEEKENKGVLFNAASLPKDANWGGILTNGSADINYLILPQCLKVSGISEIEAGWEKSTIVLEEGSLAEGCTTAFNCSEIASFNFDLVSSCGNTTINNACSTSSSGCGTQGTGNYYEESFSSGSGTLLYANMEKLQGSPGSFDAGYDLDITFNSPISEIRVLSSGASGDLDIFSNFKYAIKKAGFNFCAGTDEASCSQ